jgi:hypothetical protein
LAALRTEPVDLHDVASHLESAAPYGVADVLFELFIPKLDDPPTFFTQQMFVMAVGPHELVLRMGFPATNPADYAGTLQMRHSAVDSGPADRNASPLYAPHQTLHVEVLPATH